MLICFEWCDTHRLHFVNKKGYIYHVQWYFPLFWPAGHFVNGSLDPRITSSIWLHRWGIFLHRWEQKWKISKNHYKSKEVIFGMIPAKNSNMPVFLPVQGIPNLVVLFTFDAICHQTHFHRWHRCIIFFKGVFKHLGILYWHLLQVPIMNLGSP